METYIYIVADNDQVVTDLKCRKEGLEDILAPLEVKHSAISEDLRRVRWIGSLTKTLASARKAFSNQLKHLRTRLQRINTRLSKWWKDRYKDLHNPSTANSSSITSIETHPYKLYVKGLHCKGDGENIEIAFEKVP